MINDNLKNIIYNLMYAKDEKDLTFQLARELFNRLKNQKELTQEEYQEYQELQKVGKIRRCNMCEKEEKTKNELVTIQKADKNYIKKIKECNERWQKAIKEGWI